MIDENTVSRDELLSRITITRMSVSASHALKARAFGYPSFLISSLQACRRKRSWKKYSDLAPLDIQACLAYGAEMSRERHVPIPITSAA